MTTTFETAKIGDRVYSHTFGWGSIECIDPESLFPIEVRFPNFGVYETFTLKGYCYDSLPVQSLFWDEVAIEAPVKPVSTKIINGVKVPDISFKPNVEERCYIPEITLVFYRSLCFYCCELYNHLSDNGMCYPDTEEGKQAAILHTKAMLNMSSSQ
jgi:hypothetical protein